MWESSFAAVAILLGASSEDVVTTLDDTGNERVRELLSTLGGPRRAARARVLAAAVQDVSVALLEVTLQ